MSDGPPPSAAFDAHAGEYDRLRRGLVPCFEGFYGAALDLIADWQAERSQEGLRLLDLGAGTGLFASLVLERFPQAQPHLLDASAPMLAQAEARLGGVAGVSFEHADMASADLDGPYDLIVSALAIHHLEHAAKRDLFRRILAALAPGGLFVNAEQVMAPEPELEARDAREWRRQAAARGAPAEAIAAAEARMQHDRCATLADQLAWLRQAGFAHVDCSFKAWRFAVYSGRKP
jgi:tRNA (cmo5U34)-methyltransferase